MPNNNFPSPDCFFCFPVISVTTVPKCTVSNVIQQVWVKKKPELINCDRVYLYPGLPLVLVKRGG